jgi:hypothetical protein
MTKSARRRVSCAGFRQNSDDYERSSMKRPSPGRWGATEEATFARTRKKAPAWVGDGMPNEPHREPPDDALHTLIDQLSAQAALVLWRFLTAWLADRAPVARDE